MVGARPQFIKAAPLSRALRSRFREILVHTGQHYDDNMSGIFFKDMGIPEPDFELGIGSGTHALQTGLMLEAVERLLIREKPDCVLVYGDTNSTLAGALAAVKLQIPLAHVEAGLRSWNREMPEEINRVLTDHCADFLFCPTDTAVRNLGREGIKIGVFRTGDVMVDAARLFGELSESRSEILKRLGLAPRAYVLCTIHRPSNTDDRSALESLIGAFVQSGETVVFPVHPRTRKQMKDFGLLSEVESHKAIRLIDPVSYLDMISLEKNARLICTDSGGIQKEAYVYRVPCVTLRKETEWIETVEDGWNILTGPDSGRILQALGHFHPDHGTRSLFGDGTASRAICGLLEKELGA
ncbi:UDP-N-acetylglucosamine 2-epimerase (non-hydrolyzing) [bacterium]|nr:UDP-N-acetylglucosamine 2-epimerase (non-hydrolyzing) [bacterium]